MTKICKKCLKELDDKKFGKGRAVCNHCLNIQRGLINTPSNTVNTPSNTVNTPSNTVNTPIHRIIVVSSEEAEEEVPVCPYPNLSELEAAISFNKKLVQSYLDDNDTKGAKQYVQKVTELKAMRIQFKGNETIEYAFTDSFWEGLRKFNEQK